jgi:hypothetical protein
MLSNKRHKLFGGEGRKVDLAAFLEETRDTFNSRVLQAMVIEFVARQAGVAHRAGDLKHVLPGERDLQEVSDAGGFPVAPVGRRHPPFGIDAVWTKCRVDDPVRLLVY